MKILRILFLLIVFSTMAIGQGLQIKDSLASAAAGKIINKYILPSSPMPVKIYGNLPPMTGVASATNQLTQITRADSLALLIKLMYYRLFGQATASNQTLSKVSLDSLWALQKLIYYRLAQNSTSNGALQTTQDSVLYQLMDRINLGGLQVYSSRRGDFTVTKKTGTKIVTITGASFTPSYQNIAYAFKRNTSTGTLTFINLKTVTDSVTGSIIKFGMMPTNFVSTDSVEVAFISTEKTIDKTLDVGKVIEQAPNWAHYSSDQVTNVAAGGDGASATTRTLVSMDGYKSVSVHKQITVASADTVTISFWASNMASPSTANDNDFVNIDNQFTKYTGGTASTTTAGGDVMTGATTFRNMYTATLTYKWLMIKRIVIDGSANSVVITTDVQRQY